MGNPSAEQPDYGQLRQQVFHATLKWTSYSDAFPLPKVYVLVRMADGTVASARCDDKKNEWSRSPFLVWGTPATWAEVPRIPHT